MAKNPWVLPEGFDSNTRKAIKALLAALKKSGATIPPAAYTQLSLGNVDGFLEFVDWEKIRAGFGDLESILASAAAKSGVSTYTLGGVEATLLFDLIDERAVQYARERVGNLIVEITDEMRNVVRETIALAQSGEMTYQAAAIRLQSTIPLTSRDAGAVDKFINKKFTQFMRSGLSESKARTKAQNMGAEYASKLLQSRTRTIARTEIIDASMSGRYLGWESGVTAGYISADSVKEWVAEPDACPICRELDGKIITWNEEWTFPEGVSAGTSNRMPPAHPNCRCAVVILPPDYAESIYTPKSGGEMPEEAEEFTKHLAGQHDQSTHGRKKSVSYDTSGYEALVGKTGGDFQNAIRELGVSFDAAIGSENRFAYRSMPAPAEMESNFVSLDKNLKELTDKNPVSIMTEEEVLESILDDGKVKSVFEIDEDMKGKQYLEYRSAYEKVAFEYGIDTPPELRPVSGIVFPSEMNDKLIDTFGTNYGSVQLVLKDDVKSRTTVTIGDSLDTFQRPTPIGGKVPRTFDLATTAQFSDKVRSKAGENYLTSESFWALGHQYVEAQVHGGVKLSDIEKVVIHYPQWIDMEATTNRLNDMGIAWEVVQ